MGGIISRIMNLSKATVIKKNPDALRIGILGAAKIAPFGLIFPARKLEDCIVYAVAARDRKKAEKYAKKYKIPMVLNSYEELITNPDIDVIYNPLPNGYHAYYTILALQNGKHVLCEKPLASNEAEVKAMIEAQKNAPLNPKTKTKPLFVEAFHYRFHPATQMVKHIVDSGELGIVKEIYTKMLLPFMAFGKDDVRYNYYNQNTQLAGGSLMDCGIYTLSCARMVAGDDAVVEVVDAKIIEAFKHVDQSAKATLKLKQADNVVTAYLQSSFRNWGFTASLTVKGTEKELYEYNFVAPFAYHYITIKDLKTGKKRTVKDYGNGGSTYEYQLRAFIGAVLGDEASSRLCNFAGSPETGQENMRIIDEIYKKAGSIPREGKSISPVLRK